MIPTPIPALAPDDSPTRGGTFNGTFIGALDETLIGVLDEILIGVLAEMLVGWLVSDELVCLADVAVVVAAKM